MTSDRKAAPMGPLDDAGLDALFAEARDETPAPLSDAFRASLLEAALAARPEAEVETRAGWWRRLRSALSDFGGAPSLAGVGAAGLAGVWIGFAAPGPTSDLVSSFWQGAATVSPGVSSWSATTDGLDYAGIPLLNLLDEQAN